jgi:hypothetical protein
MIEATLQAAFWSWFVQHEAELFDFDIEQEAERERLFDRLAAELQKVDRGLTFEFGPRGPTREFVISAAGIKKIFPAVVGLAGSAPVLERWKITAFRPRRATVMTIEIGDKSVDPKDVQFSLLNNGKMAGIYLFIPGFREDDVALQQIGYLLLDEALGEYDVETRLGLIKMLSPDERTVGERHPLAELPLLFDRLVSRLEGRSESPS